MSLYGYDAIEILIIIIIIIIIIKSSPEEFSFEL